MAIQYYPLINKIMTQLRLREENTEFAHLSEATFLKPFITVAREPGSGGSPIAQEVAARLGFTFVDEQIIDEIAHSTKKRKEIIRQIDEKGRTMIADTVHSLFNQDYVDDLRYLRELAKIILAYACKGHVVILGRGSNFITPFGKGLHVSVTAPYDVRVKRAMDYEGHSKQKAIQVIKEVEKERSVFVKQYMLSDYKKRNAYDLTLNTTLFQVDEAAAVIIEAFYRKFSRSVPYGKVFTSKHAK